MVRGSGTPTRMSCSVQSTARAACPDRCPSTSCPTSRCQRAGLPAGARPAQLDMKPDRNLATFVTTWMEPEARQADRREPHRNFIDHAEYPHDRRDRAALHPDARRPLPRARRDDRRPHAGLVRGDHARRPVAEVEVARSAARPPASPPTQPNLVFGGDVHVVWEKFCRYFDVEPRIVPLQPGKYTIGPEDVEPARRREHDRRRGRARHDLHRPRRRHRRDQRPAGQLQRRQGPRRPAARRRRQRRLRLALPLPATRSGTSGSSRCARSTSPATSSGSSTRASAG